ncbi:MAG: hypothetical protein U0271_04065 [Polyangiaceae bacterium]
MSTTSLWNSKLLACACVALATSACSAADNDRSRSGAEIADSEAAPATATSISTAELVLSVAPTADPPLSLTLSASSTVSDAVAPPPSNPDELRLDDVCADSQRRLKQAIGSYTDVETSARATVADLQPEPPRTDADFLSNSGSGYWGPTDIDGDGVEDRVMVFTSVDFWSHFVFLKKGGCLRYAGTLEGYQIELKRTKGGAIRARVYTYPIGPGSSVDAYVWNGSAFVK